MMQTYSPSKQYLLSQHPERCVTGKAPALSEIKRKYGEGITLKLLEIQINDYNNFIGVKEDMKNNALQIQEIARLICANYYFLKISEIMLFFFRLKSGKYGKNYGAVDGVSVMSSLRDFVDDRNAIIDRVESEKRAEERQKQKAGAISWEEYQTMKQS